ncbi:MAG TPA: hypothetical protein VEX11_00920 [Acetobacteraceae bacterium]|nr:hypothetical protein [Acetobacteraceae bacterium]
MLFRLAGAVVPDGTGLMEVRGGTFAPDPVADPDLEAEEGGAVPVPAEPPGFGCPLGVPVVIPWGPPPWACAKPVPAAALNSRAAPNAAVRGKGRRIRVSMGSEPRQQRAW